MQIAAFVACRKLKSAYLIAVKAGLASEVRRIQQVAAQFGQDAVQKLCAQWLSKNEGRK